MVLANSHLLSLAPCPAVATQRVLTGLETLRATNLISRPSQAHSPEILESQEGKQFESN